MKITHKNINASYDDQRKAGQKLFSSSNPALWMGAYWTPEGNKKKVYFEASGSFDSVDKQFKDSIPEPYKKAILRGTAPSQHILEKDGFKYMKITSSKSAYKDDGYEVIQELAECGVNVHKKSDLIEGLKSYFNYSKDQIHDFLKFYKKYTSDVKHGYRVAATSTDIECYSHAGTSVPIKDIRAVAKAAADVVSAEELAKVVSSLKLIDEKYWKDVMMAWSSREYSPAALGKIISDDLYNMYLSVESCEVTSSTYVDVSGVIGETGEEFTEAELKNIYNDLHDYDPVVMDYASFEDWLNDTLKTGYIEVVEACNDASTPVESAKVTSYDTDFMLKLAKEIKDKCHEVMTSEDYGWPEDEVDDYLVVEVEPTELYGDPYYKVEIRAEMTYSGMTGLAEECNSIVEKYDENAYFDHVTGGIIDAYIRVKNNVTGSYSEDIEAALVEPPQEVVDELISLLNDYGFVLDPEFRVNPGKTWMGHTHIQVINLNSHVDESADNLRDYVPRSMIDSIHQLEDSFNCPITWSFGANDNGQVTGGLDIYEQWIPDDESDLSSVEGSYYGGAYDIDPEQFFTKEEYMEFAANVEDELNKMFKTKIRYTDVYALEPNSIYLDVEDEEGNEFSWGVIIDMRRIRKPSDLEKYHDAAVTKLVRDLKRWYSEYSPESIVESAVYRIPERSIEPPPEKSFGLDDINDYIEIELDDDVEVYNDEDRYGFDIEDIDEICEDVILDYEDSLRGLVDESDIQELIEFMIDSRLPDEPGRYHLRAKLKIFYEISGLWENEYGEEIDDDATISYDYNKSTVDDFQCKKVD